MNHLRLKRPPAFASAASFFQSDSENTKMTYSQQGLSFSPSYSESLELDCVFREMYHTEDS